MSKFNNINKKVKITYNNLDNNMDIDSVFREMDKIFSKVDSNANNINEYADTFFGGKSNISIKIIDSKEKKEPKNLTFKKWMKWINS
jgi:hypothetical protein